MDVEDRQVGIHAGDFTVRLSTTSPNVRLRVGANSPWAPVWFAPPMPPDGRVTTTVTFSAPGTYVLRARADDGPATTDDDVTVTVTP